VLFAGLCYCYSLPCSRSQDFGAAFKKVLEFGVEFDPNTQEMLV
jgi:hypothetical protein